MWMQVGSSDSRALGADWLRWAAFSATGVCPIGGGLVRSLVRPSQPQEAAKAVWRPHSRPRLE